MMFITTSTGDIRESQEIVYKFHHRRKRGSHRMLFINTRTGDIGESQNIVYKYQHRR